MEQLSPTRRQRQSKWLPPVYYPDTTNEISDEGLYVSEEEYWEKYYDHPDFSYEWNNGYLEVKPVTDLKGFLAYIWFQEILKHFLSVNPIATMVGLDIGFRLGLAHKTSIRKPDLAVLLNENPMIIEPDDCNYKGTFDLCIESLSYSSSREIKRDTKIKKKEYEGIGVREYYILDARKKETSFYRLNRSGIYEPMKPVKQVFKSKVLPGFQFRMSDLYKQPSLEQMAQDIVYQHFVLPFYNMEKQRAEQEKLKAEQEKRRAEQEKLKAQQERERADRLAEKLRSLGVSPEDI
ncbi:Putative restriction endonuclease, DUF820 [Desulfonema limicola]|uniref:Restriction endonuclease, DUF820 n=1 Tax=Desulfonema limicola TaxID=45656 RepID=A0A975GH04_9BACT|nr:Uma2 family endonuclease [Desulfonema limicola]QTA80895.1 Putative restriction endonuclease, DUF820 [Desulfonema limicola]